MKDFFKETGEMSMMRLLSFMCVLIACIIAMTGLLLDKDVVSLVSAFLSAGMLGKAVQSFSEK